MRAEVNTEEVKSYLFFDYIGNQGAKYAFH